MLRKVILLIKENILQKKVLCGESMLLNDLRMHGVEVSVGAGIQDSYQSNGEYIQQNTVQNGIEDILYITDSEMEYQCLKATGKVCASLPARRKYRGNICRSAICDRTDRRAGL